jgi:imidazolonepropionase-like amidohydrolase
MCFARLREAEFAMRLQGTPYMDILKQGGGILSSVQAVAETEEAALLENTLVQARRALRLEKRAESSSALSYRHYWRRQPDSNW